MKGFFLSASLSLNHFTALYLLLWKNNKEIC